MTQPLEDLLRACQMRYGHIQLFRDASGWQASVYHYEPKRLTHDGVACEDPVEALRLALIEDERKTRDVERRYKAAPKKGGTKPAVAPEPSDDFEGLFE